MKIIDLELKNIDSPMLTIKTVTNGKPFIVRIYDKEAIRVFTNVKDLLEIMINDIKKEEKKWRK